MTNLVKRFILMKQAKCINAIKYVVDGRNLDIYNTGNNLIKYHKEFVDVYGINDPLTIIKRFYKNDLEYRKVCLKSAKEDEINELLNIVEADCDILDELSEDFINRYNRVVACMKYITFNKNYLNEDQKREYLKKYYSLTKIKGNNDDVEVRSVK